MTMNIFGTLTFVSMMLWNFGLCVTRKFPQKEYKKCKIEGKECAIIYERCLECGDDRPDFKSSIETYDLFKDNEFCACIEFTRIKQGVGAGAFITINLKKFFVEEYSFYTHLVDFFNGEILHF